MPFELTIDYDRGVAVYRQIYEAVLAALASGQLETDEQLPTIHELSARLDVNPNTVARAYRELERDGHLVARRGKGTFAAEAPDDSHGNRDAVLRGIFDRAVAEAARHRISPTDVVDFFRKALP